MKSFVQFVKESEGTAPLGAELAALRDMMRMGLISAEEAAKTVPEYFGQAEVEFVFARDFVAQHWPDEVEPAMRNWIFDEVERPAGVVVLPDSFEMSEWNPDEEEWDEAYFFDEEQTVEFEILWTKEATREEIDRWLDDLTGQVLFSYELRPIREPKI
jgi:hypothetical protein